MAGTKFGSRKLMLILAFLLINSHSISYLKLSATSSEDAGVTTQSTDKSSNKDVVWLVDTTSGQCLGSHGDFSECGELTLWIWNKLKGGFALQSVSSIEEESNAVHSIAGECLGRRRSLLKENALTMRRCSSEAFSPTSWTFDESTGMMSDSSGFMAKVVGPACVSNSDSILQSCKKGFTALKRVVFHRSHDSPTPKPAAPSATVAQPLDTSSSIQNDDFSDVGTWTCPVTSQVFPRNLDQRFRSVSVGGVGVAQPVSAGGAISSTRGGGSASTNTVASGRQVFMGSGVFSKMFMGMNFNVYSMAWYVEAEAAQSDPSLLAFKDHSLSELQTTEAFFQALSSAGRGFDRTLMVKLAMTLKTKMLLDGFLAEIALQPQNKEAVRRASAAYTAPVCSEGLEIIFTWRVPHKHSSSSSSKPSKDKPTTGTVSADHEYLEVRIGDMYFELHERGLAEDFMRQFFAPKNPVSPSAKKAFVTYFPSLLRGSRYVPSPMESGSGGVKDSVTGPVSVPVGGAAAGKYAGLFSLRGWKTAV